MQFKERISSLILVIGAALVLNACGEGEEKNDSTSIDINNIKVELTPLEKLNKELASAPSAATYNKRSKYYLKEGDVEKAFEDMQMATSLDSLNGLYWLTGAEILRQNVQIPLSLEYAKRAETLGCKKERLFLLMCEENLILMQYQTAIDYANKALKVNPFSHKAYYYKGMVYEETNDLKRAISSYQTALEQKNTFADAYNNLIKLYTAQGDFYMASQYVESGLRFVPDDVFLHYNYGVMLESQGLLDSALTVYKKAEPLDTTFDLLRFKIATIQATLNNREEACLYYDQVLKLNPSFELAYSEYGELLKDMGKEQQAKEVLRRGLIRFPDSKSIKILYDQIN